MFEDESFNAFQQRDLITFLSNIDTIRVGECMGVEPESREGAAEEVTDDEEDSCRGFTHKDLEIIRKVVLRQMRRTAPHLYVVLKAWRDERALRDEPSQYQHGVGKGFYARLAKQLGLERQSVLYRLRMALRLAAELLHRHEQS